MEGGAAAETAAASVAIEVPPVVVAESPAPPAAKAKRGRAPAEESRRQVGRQEERAKKVDDPRRRAPTARRSRFTPPLPREFYDRRTEQVARDLLGAVLEWPNAGLRRGRKHRRDRGLRGRARPRLPRRRAPDERSARHRSMDLPESPTSI